jgi:hypothetical protein
MRLFPGIQLRRLNLAEVWIHWLRQLKLSSWKCRSHSKHTLNSRSGNNKKDSEGVIHHNWIELGLGSHSYCYIGGLPQIISNYKKGLPSRSSFCLSVPIVKAQAQWSFVATYGKLVREVKIWIGEEGGRRVAPRCPYIGYRRPGWRESPSNTNSHTNKINNDNEIFLQRHDLDGKCDGRIKSFFHGHVNVVPDGSSRRISCLCIKVTSSFFILFVCGFVLDGDPRQSGCLFIWTLDVALLLPSASPVHTYSFSTSCPYGYRIESFLWPEPSQEALSGCLPTLTSMNACGRKAHVDVAVTSILK